MQVGLLDVINSVQCSGCFISKEEEILAWIFLGLSSTVVVAA